MNPTPQHIRNQVMADPHTADIAAGLQMPLNEYVDLVVEYALNPEMGPQLMMPDAEMAKEMGIEKQPSMEELMSIVHTTVAVEKMSVTEFETEAKKPMVSLSPELHRVPASQSAPERKVPDELLKHVSRLRFGAK